MKHNSPLQKPLFILVALFFLLLSCNLPRLETTIGPSATLPGWNEIPAIPSTSQLAPTQTPYLSASDFSSPTPDANRKLPTLRVEAVQYAVQRNDTVERIAASFWVGVNTIVQANQIENPNLISVGDVLIIPAPAPKPSSPGYKILPDTEVVYGPSAAGFDIKTFLQEKNGFLASFSEEVDGVPASGADIILRVCEDYSVNPRMLITLLEYQSGWITQTDPPSFSLQYPLGFEHAAYVGLYDQLTWAANEINRGYYLWRVNGIPGWVLKDDSVVLGNPGINAGSAGLYFLLAKLHGYDQWLSAVTENGFQRTYMDLFGYPFVFQVEPIVPDGAIQPNLQLPIEVNQIWRFTGGPHGAFSSGSAWAALDFAPPGEALGCVQSDAWVAAMADGWIVRSGRGQVIQELDGDGYEQTGWVLQYLHIETRDRIPSGTYVHAGDRLGHPSCEGGISTGTHVHIARRYNGEWIPADGNKPFILDGWVSSGAGTVYNGLLTKNDQVVKALVGNRPENQIQR